MHDRPAATESAGDDTPPAITSSHDMQRVLEDVIVIKEHCRVTPILYKRRKLGAAAEGNDDVVSCSAPHAIIDDEQEEEEEGCVTPTARQQRIPREILECPPPPKKKKKKRRGSAVISKPMKPCNPPHNVLSCVTDDHHNQHAAEPRRWAVLVLNPPDLDTFPECIRALFC